VTSLISRLGLTNGPNNGVDQARGVDGLSDDGEDADPTEEISPQDIRGVAGLEI